ncbi:hypothetical protein WJX73_002148 [Symbiochloris irregularis]|uniref:Endo-beta-1,6-galactanase-like domain-containing protein n=1 Tax=Symbiochloris irregularis TaxID=706552 RepID=A0AAW1NQ10_9CHLO
MLGEKLKNYLQRLKGRVAPNLVIDPRELQQSFEGWGTSLCWFANVLGACNDATTVNGQLVSVRDHIADLLFNPDKGLGLQICRYNIGGSGWQTKDTGKLRYGANVESFWGPEGQWDWELDAGQRWMLLAARSRGARHFEAFSNSPPYWMTKSGRASGSVQGKAGHDNLAPERYDDFIHYLVTVVRWYHEKHQLTFRTLDPFNEPDTTYWWAGNNQEGCHFDPATQNVILQKLHAALKKDGLLSAGVQLAASDETSIDTAVSSFKSYSPATLDAIAQVNAHAYEGTARAELRDLVYRARKRLWMSEWGCGAAPLKDMGGAIQLAACILRDLNTLQAQAWVYWQAVENSETGNWWGLMQVPFHKPQQVELGKQYWAMMHYSRFIRDGYTILKTRNPSNVVAAISPTSSGKTTAVVVTASGPAQLFTSQRLTTYDFTPFGAKGEGEVTIYRTDARLNMKRIDSFFLTAPLKFSIVIPPMSMTTVVMHFERTGKAPKADGRL